MTLFTTKEAAKKVGLKSNAFINKAYANGIYPKGRINKPGRGRPTSVYTKTQVRQMLELSL